jgi:cytochrome c oxidase assembly protein subunit 11
MWEKLISASNVPREMLPGGGGSASGAGTGGSHARTWTDEEAAAKLASLRPRRDGKLITVRFDSTVGDVLPWTFVPAQLDVKVVPGETALSFFTATNKSDKAITGVATYNVHPPKVGLYFNKIQCFCFEEQRLLPGETVDMPVFFFIDPEIVDDPQLRHVNNVTLSYTFFQTDVDYEDEEDEEEGADEDVEQVAVA